MSLTEAPEQPEQNQGSGLSKISVFLSAVIVVAALYAAWTFYSRYESNREALQAIQAKKEAQNKQVVDQVFGSGEVKITNFSASKRVLAPGEKESLCYGVVNAITVTISPDLGEPVKPTYMHCTEIAPKKTTTYTLTASNKTGDTKTASLTILVQ